MSDQELEALLKRGNVHIHGDNSPDRRKRRGKAGRGKDEFQSHAERLYYENSISLLMLVGEVLECKMHERFEVVPAVKFGGRNFKAKHYTPDFVLTMKDGKTKVIEIKGTVVRRLQRDYPLRRQLFILNYCIPNGWEFEEVVAEELTQTR